MRSEAERGRIFAISMMVVGVSAAVSAVGSALGDHWVLAGVTFALGTVPFAVGLRLLLHPEEIAGDRTGQRDPAPPIRRRPEQPSEPIPPREA